MRCYYLEPKTKKYVKGYGFLSLGGNLLSKYGKQLLDAATTTGLNALKTATKKVAHKQQENS